MRKQVFYTQVFIVIMLCVAASVSSCANKDKAESTVDQVEPDSRFAVLDSLAGFMTQNLMEKAPENLVERYESQSAAIKSYWELNHKGEDQNQMTETVFGELKAMADSLSGGSTMDIVQSNDINRAIAQYLTVQDYCNSYRENPLYQAEMSDWLQLEKELEVFYGELARLANWGGSISNVTASGSMAYLAQTRQEDYSQLKKGGQFANSELPTISEARTNLIEELSSAKSLEDDLVDDEGFRETLKDMREHADKVVELLDKWLESRTKLCEAEGVPESHTAHLIAKLGNRIMELIEG